MRRIETRAYTYVTGHGRTAQRATVTVECVEQRGKFYASMNTLNASRIGVGNTPDEAFAEWAKLYNAVRCDTKKSD